MKQDKALHIDTNKKSKGQAALEYLTTYGWAFIIIALATAALYLFITLPYQIAPPTCNFVNGLFCNDVVIAANSSTHTTQVALLLTNVQKSSLSNPMLNAKINGKNTSSFNCLPDYVLPGGSIICLITLPTSSNVGAFVSGNLYLNATYCSSPLKSTSTNCQGGVQQVYPGTFSGDTESYLSTVTISFSFNASNYSQPISGPPDQLRAVVKLLGYPLKGATVNFTDPDLVNFPISPNTTTSNSNGTALSYLFGTTPGTVQVTAYYAGLSNSVIITFSNSTGGRTTRRTSSSTASSTSTTASTSSSTVTSSTSTSVTTTSSTSTSSTSSTSTSTSSTSTSLFTTTSTSSTSSSTTTSTVSTVATTSTSTSTSTTSSKSTTSKSTTSTSSTSTSTTTSTSTSTSSTSTSTTTIFTTTSSIFSTTSTSTSTLPTTSFSTTSTSTSTSTTATTSIQQYTFELHCNGPVPSNCGVSPQAGITFSDPAGSTITITAPSTTHSTASCTSGNAGFVGWTGTAYTGNALSDMFTLNSHVDEYAWYKCI